MFNVPCDSFLEVAAGLWVVRNVRLSHYGMHSSDETLSSPIEVTLRSGSSLFVSFSRHDA
jgi:hypothetical protein